jgi:AcrR family transcriptional regulator
MAGRRLPGDESRVRLIEAAAQIINSEGYAALSARTLAERVGLKRQIVHYYFRTMDDLLLAVIRHYGDEAVSRFSQAVTSQDPLQAIWEVKPDSSATTFAFIAMASHKTAIREEMLKYLHKLRELQSKAVERYLKARQIKSELPPIAVAILLQSISQTLNAETSLGTTMGHAETRAVVVRWLTGLSLEVPERRQPARRSERRSAHAVRAKRSR